MQDSTQGDSIAAFSAWPGQDLLFETLTALMNHFDSILVWIGVDNDGTVTGLTKDEAERIVWEVRACQKSVFVEHVNMFARETELEGKHVVQIEGGPTWEPIPYKEKYYYRVGNANEVVGKHLIDELAAFQDDSGLEVLDSFHMDLNQSVVSHRFNEIGIALCDFATDPYLAGAFTPTTYGYNLLSLLLADQNDVSLRVIHLSGSPFSSEPRSLDFGHVFLYEAMRRVEEYIWSLSYTPEGTSESFESEKCIVDKMVFHEVWKNACLHNQWADRRSPVVLIDRKYIEVISFGGLPRRLGITNFFAGHRVKRNRDLYDFSGLFYYGPPVQWKHGIPFLVSELGRKAFTIDSNSVKVRIPFLRNE